MRSAAVRFLGHISHEQTLIAIRGARFLILSSDWYEAFCVGMIEAFGCGVPVICSRLGAMQEIVTDWRSGPHFAPGDADDLANAFYKLASDPELRARLSLGAIKRVEEHFNWDKKGLIVAKLYESLSAAKEGMAVEPKLSA